MKRTGAKGLFPVRLPYQPPATTPADARRRVGSRARPFLPGPRPRVSVPSPPEGLRVKWALEVRNTRSKGEKRLHTHLQNTQCADPVRQHLPCT